MLTTENAAIRIRRELAETEIAVNSAIQQAATLMQTMAAARGIPGVQAATGQAALLRMAAMQAKLVEAASDGFRVHSELLKIQRDVLGIFDENGECPGETFTSGQLAAA